MSFKIQSLIGLQENDAIEKIKEYNLKCRIISKDGKNFICTRDFRNDRVILVIVNENVTEARIG